jgi:hypothetical protein
MRYRSLALSNKREALRSRSRNKAFRHPGWNFQRVMFFSELWEGLRRNLGKVIKQVSTAGANGCVLREILRVLAG